MATEHEYRQMLERYRKAAQECRSRFDERIKNYRMGRGEIRLVNEQGEPLRHAKMEIA